MWMVIVVVHCCIDVCWHHYDICRIDLVILHLYFLYTSMYFTFSSINYIFWFAVTTRGKVKFAVVVIIGGIGIVVVVTRRFIWVCSCKFTLGSADLRLLLQLVIITKLSVRYRPRNLILLRIHNLLLVLTYLTGPLWISLTLIASFSYFVISAIATLIYLLHLVLILL